MLLASIILLFTLGCMILVNANLMGSLRKAEAREAKWEAMNQGLVDALNRQTALVRSLTTPDAIAAIRGEGK